MKGYCVGSAGVVVAALYMVLTPVFAQNLPGRGQGRGQGANAPTSTAGLYTYGEVHVLPPGGPAPRMADGHVDLSGRYYPNQGGRMLDSATPPPATGSGEDRQAAMRQYDPKVTPQENEVFRPESKAIYQQPTPYGSCPPGGTPTSITTQATEHGPMELVQRPGVLWVLSEFPQTIRRIAIDGPPHPKDPDPTFNGDSTAHWEGDTLVVDTIAIDTRMRNISVGATGDANAWSHSDKEHVVERFSRPSKNYVVYQVTVEDAVVLGKPFTSAPHKWSLAQDPNDVWTEYICTDNEEPAEWQKFDTKIKSDYERPASEKGSGPAPDRQQ